MVDLGRLGQFEYSAHCLIVHIRRLIDLHYHVQRLIQSGFAWIHADKFGNKGLSALRSWWNLLLGQPVSVEIAMIVTNLQGICNKSFANVHKADESVEYNKQNILGGRGGGWNGHSICCHIIFLLVIEVMRIQIA